MSSEIENECRLSYFKVIGTVNEKHNVYYVQNVEDKKIYVKKTLSVYNKDVYEYIKSTGSAFYPKIYECVEKDNHLIVIEEYINGDTLEEIIRKRGMLSEKETGDIALRLCRALSLLHSHVPAFIHRDIKPSNIMITNDNIMKIIDINSAKEFHENSSEDIAELTKTLKAAAEKLVERGDLTDLNILLETAEALDANRYTEESYNKLLDIIKTIKVELKDSSEMLQTDVDKLQAKLQAAIDALEIKPSVTPNEDGIINGNTASDTTTSSKTGDDVVIGSFLVLGMLSIAGLWLYRKKENC